MDFYLTIRLWAREFYEISIIVDKAEGRILLKITIPVISGLRNSSQLNSEFDI